MKCYNVRPHLEKLAAGEISPFLAGQLREHLQSCPGCNAEYAKMKEAVEMWRQSPRMEPAPQFSPVWRQRVRQEALKNEANRRSFFSVFKSNTLIPALSVVVIFAVAGMFNVYHRFAPKIIIEPQITRYSPALSTTVGIPLIVKFRNGRAPQNMIYHWTADYGRFLSWNGEVSELGANVETGANKVYWSIDLNDRRELSSFKVHLRVKAVKTGKTIAQAELELEKDGAEFVVVKK